MDEEATNNIEDDISKYEKEVTDEQAQLAISAYEKEAETLVKDPEQTQDFIKSVTEKLANVPAIGGLLEDVTLLCCLVTDFIKGQYKEIPIGSIVGVLGALLYFISPIDIIPDFIPVIGYIDDVGVIAFAIKSIDEDIQRYKLWRNEYIK